LQIDTISRIPRTVAVFGMAALLLFASACGGKGDSKSGGTASAALSGPKDTLAFYRSNCISCHGADLSGNMGPESDLRKVGARLSEAQIVRQITDGGKLMQPMKDRLSAQEIDALAAWLAEKR